jgi:hypothetical protein
MTNSSWLVAARSISSDNDLCSGRPNNSSDDLRQTLLRQGPARVPTRGARTSYQSQRAGGRSAGGADGLVGGEAFSGCHHLSTDDGCHLPTSRSPLKSSRTGEH